MQTAVVNFVEWMRDPHSKVGYTAQAFELVPQDLTRRIALRQTVDMVRVTMEFFEEVVPMLARERRTAHRADRRHPALQPRPGIRRGRLLRRCGRGPRLLGQPDGGQRRRRRRPRRHRPRTAVPGGGAELGHHRAGDGGGRHPRPAATAQRQERASEDVREIAARHGRAALADVHGTWLVAIVSGHVSPTERFLGDLLNAFSDGPVVIGPTAPMLTAAYHSATEAISGMNAVVGWSGAPRPVLARELLPERALLGDARRSRRCTPR